MTTVHTSSSDLNNHLFRSDTRREEHTVDPADVALSSQHYSNQDLPQLNPPEDGHAGDDKDLDAQLPSPESSPTAIQMLDTEPVESNGALHVDEVNSSDDSQEWTEGESQEHKRVKVCSISTLPFLGQPPWLLYRVSMIFTTLHCSIIHEIRSHFARFTSLLVCAGKTREQPSVLAISTK
jgi:hypothetical protein